MCEAAKKDALRFLAIRCRSEAEMRERLLQKNTSAEDIETVINWLYELEYLDDLAFAEAFVRDRLRFHPCGRVKLREELSKKQIDAKTIRRALSKNYPLSLECRVAKALARKKAAQGRTPTQIKRYLYGKGFDADILMQVDEDIGE